MKNTLFLIVMTVMTVLLASCEKIDMAEEGNDNNTSTSSSKSLSIKALTTDASSLPYPLSLYAFDSNGNCKAQINITEAVTRENTSFQLPSGQYCIVALHTPSSYPAQPSNPSINTNINLPAENYAKEAFYLGMTEVNLTSNNQSADVTMKPLQARVSISLGDVPNDVNKIDVTISSPYGKIAFGGEFSNKQDVTIPCVKSGDKWITDEAYILPSQSSPTLFNFKLRKNDGTQSTYQFTYNGTLNAGTPYSFDGKYSNTGDQTQLALQTNIAIDIWNSTVTKSFSFGPSVGFSEGTSNSVTEFPADGEIWEGHVVALADMIDDNSCNLMLISLKEWDDVSSAFSSNKTMATSIADEYIENGIDGWSIPNTDEVEILRAVYCPENYTYNLSILNEQIEKCGGTAIQLKDYSGKNVRYLAEGGEKAFSFVKGSSTGSAGATTKYYLRLIKNVVVKKQ